MGRISTTVTTLLAAVLLLGGTVAGVSCSKGNGGSGDHDGLLRLALNAGGLTITAVHYQVVKSDMTPFAPPIEGVIDTSDGNATPSVDHSVPASTGDIAVMNAAATDGTLCSGQSMPFNVVAGQQVAVTINLVCGGSNVATNSGSAVVNGKLVNGDNCPVLTSWVASPLQTSAPSGKIDVAGTATDADSDETLTFTWTATAGTFAAPTTTGIASGGTVATQYTCTTVGAQTLTLSVTDDHNAANPLAPACPPVTIDFPVKCINTVFCGNGVVDPGSNEECDPPMPGFCDANCKRITCECGDGILEPLCNKQCDHGAQNGLDGICGTDCKFVPPVCGDGHVTGTEQCDTGGAVCNTPPTATTIKATTCCDPTVCNFVTVDINPACDACEHKTFPTGKAKFSCSTTLFGNASGIVGCGIFSGSLKTECDALRTCIVTKHCAGTNGYNPDDPTPCFCGALDATTCNMNGAPTTAPCYTEYQAALAGGPAGTVFDLFTNPGSPIGVVNNIVKCDLDAVAAGAIGAGCSSCSF
jgi:hypothetical protein